MQEFIYIFMNMYIEIYVCIHIYLHTQTQLKKRDHEFERAKTFEEGKEGGKWCHYNFKK